MAIYKHLFSENGMMHHFNDGDIYATQKKPMGDAKTMMAIYAKIHGYTKCNVQSHNKCTPSRDILSNHHITTHNYYKPHERDQNSQLIQLLMVDGLWF